MRKIRMAGFGIAALGMSVALAFAAEDESSPGRTLFINGKCQQCHSVSALKISKVENGEPEESGAEEEKVSPPDLSGIGKSLTAEWISKWLKKEETNQEGRKHKKKFKGSDADLQVLSAWLAALKYDSPKDKKGAAAVVTVVKADTVAKVKKDSLSAKVPTPPAKPAKALAPKSEKDNAYLALRDSLYSVIRDSVAATVKDSLSKALRDCQAAEKKDAAANAVNAGKAGKAK